MQKQFIGEALTRMREHNPLIHNITNDVVMNFTANGLLAIGAAPVMAHAKEEVEDMVKISQALVLNIGTLDKQKVDSMILAGKTANNNGVPVVFDPVGAGATPFRTKAALNIMKEVNVAVLRGNVAEISNMVGQQSEIRGVDAGESDGDKLELAKEAADRFNTTVVITGKTDVISNGFTTYSVENGDSLLTNITGTGCLLSAVIGAFITNHEDVFNGTIAATAVYGIAAELAAEKVGKDAPGSFQVEFINQLHTVDAEAVQSKVLVQENPATI